MISVHLVIDRKTSLTKHVCVNQAKSRAPSWSGLHVDLGQYVFNKLSTPGSLATIKGLDLSASKDWISPEELVPSVLKM